MRLTTKVVAKRELKACVLYFLMERIILRVTQLQPYPNSLYLNAIIVSKRKVTNEFPSYYVICMGRITRPSKSFADGGKSERNELSTPVNKSGRGDF